MRLVRRLRGLLHRRDAVADPSQPSRVTTSRSSARSAASLARILGECPLAQAAARRERPRPAREELENGSLDRIWIPGIGPRAGIPFAHEPGRHVLRTGDAQDRPLRSEVFEDLARRRRSRWRSVEGQHRRHGHLMQRGRMVDIPGLCQGHRSRRCHLGQPDAADEPDLEAGAVDVASPREAAHRVEDGTRIAVAVERPDEGERESSRWAGSGRCGQVSRIDTVCDGDPPRVTRRAPAMPK